MISKYSISRIFRKFYWQETKAAMKRILAVAIALGVLLGTVSISFGQDTSGGDQKMSSKKKGGKKKKGTGSDGK